MMFPIRINVLSKSKKTHLKRLTLFTYLKGACAIIFSLVSILAALLAVSKNYFIDYQSAFTYSTPSGHVSYHVDITYIEEANKKLKKIDQVQQEFTLWSPLIDEILSVLPADTEIHSLIFDREAKALAIAGIAKTREALALCEQRLKALPSLESVRIPLGELTRKEDIPFTVDAILK